MDVGVHEKFNNQIEGLPLCENPQRTLIISNIQGGSGDTIEKRDWFQSRNQSNIDIELQKALEIGSEQLCTKVTSRGRIPFSS